MLLGAIVSRLGIRAASVFALLFAAACGPASKEPAKQAPTAKTAEEPAPPPPAASSEIGGLNEEEVERSFGRMEEAIRTCFGAGSTKVSALGGHFKMKLRIDRQGALKWAYLAESTLGDRETETCLLTAARQKTWPLPVGGDGLAEKSFDLDPSSPPKELDPAKYKLAIALANKETAKCRKRGTWGAKFLVTAYLRIDGRPITLGIAPPNEKGEEVVDCMVKIIQKIKFGSTGRKVAKLGFEMR